MNPQRAHQRTALAYEIAADPHWVSAGSTRQSGPVALPERRATRTSAGTPYNLSVYDLVLDYERSLKEFALRHAPADEEIPAGRTALVDYVATLSERSEAARLDFGQLRLVNDLKSALTIGDADELLGELECPACRCWSLVGTRNSEGGWAAACRQELCAPTPGEPRVLSLWKVARHNVKQGIAAAA